MAARANRYAGRRLGRIRRGGETMSGFANLTIINHPLVQHKLAILREKNTSKKTFRALVDEISMLMGYEVTKDLKLEDVEIDTPLERMTARKVGGKKLTLVPIL